MTVTWLSEEETKVVWKVPGVPLLTATHCWPKVMTDNMTSKVVRIGFLIVNLIDFQGGKNSDFSEITAVFF